MNTTYAQRQTTAQKKDAPSAFSVIDASSQSESLQRKADMANSTAQRVGPPRPNNTGMPDDLKAGIESLSGFSMDDVRVHYNSPKPATVQALAYTQGTDIHVAPGQEKHLPHEAWHVAQQMAGRVSPTTNINGMPVNDNAALEHEADVMGEKAVTQRKANDCLDSKKIDGNSKKTCQMLRVINAYIFFDKIERLKEEDLQGKNEKEKKEIREKENDLYLFNATERLRNKYLARAGKILNECFATTPAVNREKLKPYAPKTWEYGDEIQIEQEYNERIRKNDDKLTDYPNNTKEFIDKNENLVINAHGSQGESFASFTPHYLAKAIYKIFPKGYTGEIYLAGCHTGERDSTNDKDSSYIEKFYNSLKNYREYMCKDKEFKPSIKGNKNTSISEEDGVYVLEGGNMNVKGSASKLSQYGEAPNYRNYYKGKNTKSHIASDGEWKG